MVATERRKSGEPFIEGEINMLLTCDPGSGGGWAWEFNNEVFAEKMPETPADIYEFMRELATKSDGFEPVTCYIEKVGSFFSGNSGPAAVKFAKHCGHLEMSLIALKIPYHEILPNKWMTAFIGSQKYPPGMTSGKKKTIRKNKIKAKAQALFPHLKITLATADALGLLWYAMQERR